MFAPYFLPLFGEVYADELHSSVLNSDQWRIWGEEKKNVLTLKPEQK